MLWSEKAGKPKVAGNPLPPKIAALLRESWWFGLVALALYLLLILVTYNPADPGWSQSVSTSAVENRGGVFGAYLSDLLLWLFGRSAYWWIALCAGLVVWSYRRIEVETGVRRETAATTSSSGRITQSRSEASTSHR